MRELDDFIEISKYAGERFDLVQAGGGNSSVKCEDGTMFIKASGFSLSEVENSFAYSIIKNEKLLSIFNDLNFLNEKDRRMADKLAANYMNEANITPQFRPSIETLLHSILNKYTLHTHPIVVNAITNRENWKEILLELFGDKIILAEYKTPGLSLAIELKNKVKNKMPEIIFLQNHGLIITTDCKNKVIELTEYVLSKIENYLNVDLEHYKLTNKVSEYINGNDGYKYISYISDDSYLNDQITNEYVDSLPFCPDKLVYCGIKALALVEHPEKQIENYKECYHNIPKVVIYKNRIFFIAKNIKKAKEIEDVFKFHLLSLNLNKSRNINYLSGEEIEYLDNWEAEKYRKEL